MRFKEFESEAANIMFVKFAFEKTLRALGVRYAKRLKLHKQKVKAAKQKRKNRRTNAHKRKAGSISAVNRPKRIF